MIHCYFIVIKASLERTFINLRNIGVCSPVGRAGERGRSFRAAIGRVGQPCSGSDGERFKGGKERHEAQRSDAEREETQNFFQISSYAFSISH